jgi:23S rRNA (cytosine1962-C5)-methyltransferase
MSRVILKDGKEKSVLKRHPWIFSGAIAQMPSFSDGEILPVYSAKGELLASAYFHSKTSIAGRILSFGAEDPLQAIQRHIHEAVLLRKNLMPEGACRLIHAEADHLPGLIVDRYGDVLVVQIHTLGMEKLKPVLVKILADLLRPRSIYEKSTSASRHQEGLSETSGVLWGDLVPEVTIIEHGIAYTVPIVKGQKTGFFLDQRLMRQKVLELSKGKRVLNCFAYTGGFSYAALKGGATHVTSVEISPEACSHLKGHHVVQGDVFDFLRTDPLNYDLIILDPPAFAKKRSDIEGACRGYKEINRLVFQKIPAQTLLLTCSCSSLITSELFQNLIFQSALEANRNVRIVGRHLLSPDHPISLNHPEGDYLKSLLCYIN